MDEIQKRVHAGATFLSLMRGGRWWDEIDTDTLRLTDMHNCVLGQLYGNFWDAFDQWGLTTDEAVNLGFYVHLDYSALDVEAELSRVRDEWTALTHEWRRFITDLREFATRRPL